ncbi:hypothetical protein MTR_7g010070 [Medicago truncatula]|uniref:Uncharacterized protein n=1 Tax=Medicago truncatula TaxID=3880 RepID=G7KZY0_MEDTR|nr:hypothetical protein MTR_7g010070 [Medicago truncatula]
MDTLIIEYIEQGKLPTDTIEARFVKKRASKHTFIVARLFHKGFSTPLLVLCGLVNARTPTPMFSRSLASQGSLE